MPYYKKEMQQQLKLTMKNIENAVYSKTAELKVTARVTPEPIPFNKRMSLEERIIAIGEKWGNLWDCAWFHFTGQVPENAKGKKVVLLIDVNGELCIMDEEGCPVQGLTSVNSEYDYSLGKPGKRVVYVAEKAKGGERIDIWADAGCNDLFGNFKGNGTLKEAHIAICNESMRKLYYDFEVLSELLQYLPEDKARYQSIFFSLYKASMALNKYTDEEAEEARRILKPEINKRGGDPSLTISAVGHAHIDLAWLWPIRETIRKGARTFSTVLNLMNRYPDYIFGASQPQLYQWMKDYYPALYEKIKLKVHEGRWEPQGAMWVEADTNVSGGEALVRQVLYGKRFFQKEFNKDMKILWLPDVFGYTAALPQILKKAGVEYFTTIKLSWNRYNQIPHHTFIWKGLDGSSVLVHMPPEGTYNSSAAPRAVVSTEKRYLDKMVSDRALMLFGIGDGGGGPGEEHLERLEREKNLEGLVPVVQEPALDFFKRLEARRDDYKTWTGELYLEFHQGTYTTQSRNKWYNRKMEIALRELELWAVMASTTAGFTYPKEELESVWKEVLLYQFHDILPGSSITRVYNESLARYQYMMERIQKLTKDACCFIGGVIDTSDKKHPVLVFNSLSWERNEWIKTDDRWLHVRVPAMGYALADIDDLYEIPQCMSVSDSIMENDKVKIEFAADGTICSIIDKTYHREVLEPGSRANSLALYNDPGNAWDFSADYDEQIPEVFKLESTKSYLDGPCAVVEHIYTYNKSKLVQKVVLTAGSRRIDFITEVDWNESEKMLRTSFPVNVYTNEVTCNIQFGSIKRPVHQNTSWDMARYEICAHKWVDLSQGDYGVALINDSKYGHKVNENVIDLNLLRSSSFPDPEADKGHHRFTYSLYPHKGGTAQGQVDRAGYELNIPLSLIRTESGTGELPSNKSLINVEADNIIIEAVKQAEDSLDMIVRLYECNGSGARTRVYFGFEVESVQMVNLMEESARELAVQQNYVDLTFKPFEIQTLKIILK